MRLKTGWAIAIMVILVVGSVVFGAYRGWSDERVRVNETYAGLESMLQTRVETAYNVLAVSKRYESQMDQTASDACQKVKDELAVLESGASLEKKAQANEGLTRDASALLESLSGMASVRRDSRDEMYVTSYLPQMLAESEEKTAGAAYNQAAAEFNSRMGSTFSGWLARQVLGIRPAEQFIAK